MIPSNAGLRQFITQRFSDEELETFCFDYFREVGDDFGGGMSKNRKAIKLISYCENRDLLPNLTAALAKERPEPWRETFGATPVETGRRPVSTAAIDRDPRQIFLSHAKEDAEFAHRLRDDLLAEGWRVWIAPESIRPGEKWVEAINRGLETSGVFVVALTPAAVASRWVGFETGAAIDMALADEIRLVTLDVVACKPPVLWRQLQCISFRPGYETGLDGLLGWLDGEPIETGRRTVSTPPRMEARDREPEPPRPAPVPDRRVHAQTGIELIRIPAGPFLYGESKKIDNLDFFIYGYKATNAYRKIIELPEF